MNTQPQSPAAPPGNAAWERRPRDTVLTRDPAKPAVQGAWPSRGGDAGVWGGRSPAFPGCHCHG